MSCMEKLVQQGYRNLWPESATLPLSPLCDWAALKLLTQVYQSLEGDDSGPKDPVGLC